MEIVYGPTVWLAKLVILLQYLHIFCPTRRGFLFWAIQTLIWSNFIFYFADIFVMIFICSPREKIWNFLLPGHCLNAMANLITTGAWNVFSDVMILILPFYAIWHLQMPLKRKASVGLVFASGLFVCIASILRLYYSVRWSQTEDVTYVSMQVALWGLAELATVVLCGSVILIPQFFRTFRSNPKPYVGAQRSSSRKILNSYDSFGRHWYLQHREPQGIPYDGPGLSSMEYVLLDGERSSQAPRQGSGRGFNAGIMRTIQIETRAEDIRDPETSPQDWADQVGDGIPEVINPFNVRFL
ncbi:MAG: hypothetical protein Q9166_007998 [cf. Caloplaca sp. 2 TL-2023]